LFAGLGEYMLVAPQAGGRGVSEVYLRAVFAELIVSPDEDTSNLRVARAAYAVFDRAVDFTSSAACASVVVLHQQFGREGKAHCSGSGSESVGGISGVAVASNHTKYGRCCDYASCSFSGELQKFTSAVLAVCGDFFDFFNKLVLR
jgi:hypothetical protein